MLRAPGSRSSPVRDSKPEARLCTVTAFAMIASSWLLSKSSHDPPKLSLTFCMFARSVHHVLRGQHADQKLLCFRPLPSPCMATEGLSIFRTWVPSTEAQTFDWPGQQMIDHLVQASGIWPRMIVISLSRPARPPLHLAEVLHEARILPQTSERCARYVSVAMTCSLRMATHRGARAQETQKRPQAKLGLQVAHRSKLRFGMIGGLFDLPDLK